MAKTKVVQMPIDKEILEMTQALEEMENYVDGFINKTKDMNWRMVIVLGAYRAAAEYSAGIRIMLTTRPMVKVANVLLRSLFEAFSTLEYVTLREDDLYFLKEIRGSNKGQEKALEYIEDYFNERKVQKIGSLEINRVRSNLGKVVKLGESYDEMISKIEPNPKKIDYSSQTYLQLKKIDELRPSKDPETTLYYAYLQLYPKLSANVHLGMDGIMEWLEVENKKTIRYNGSGESQRDVKRVLWTTIALLKDISIRAMKELDMFDQEYDDKYQAIIEKFK